MPVIDLSLKDIEKLTKIKLPKEEKELNNIFQYVGGEVDELNGDELKLEIKCRNRPDLWYAEGIAKDLKGAFGKEKGLLELKATKSNYEVVVDKNIKTVRPFIACAVIKNCNLSDSIIKQIMQQQDKIDGTYGRKRKKTSIGIYDFDLLRFPLYYKLINPDSVKFVPLDTDRYMTPKQALTQHPKGREYAHLLKGLKQYPIFIDSAEQVLSFPPIINSNTLGKIKESTKNILIEVTGTDYDAVQNVLVMMAISFIERGGKAYKVEIHYPKEIHKKDVTPHFEIKEKRKLKVDFVNLRLGTDFSANQISSLLKKARYNAKVISSNIVEVEIPSYRTDILHDVDLIEDIAIMYGYNNFSLSELELPSEGCLLKITQKSDKIREFLIGFNAQEVLNFTLTSLEALKNSEMKDDLIKIENPINLNYSMLRKSLIPGILEFLSKNTKKEFPQVIFEVGDCVEKNQKQNNIKEVKKVCYAIAKDKVTFTEIKQVLESLSEYLNIKIEYKPKEHKTFISGRCGKLIINGNEKGIIGEIHPQVLRNWGLESPVALFELEIGKSY